MGPTTGLESPIAYTVSMRSTGRPWRRYRATSWLYVVGWAAALPGGAIDTAYAGPDEHVAADEAMLLVDARIVAGLNSGWMCWQKQAARG